MATYFISDLHFHHKNILAYEPSRLVATAAYVAETQNMAVEDALTWVRNLYTNGDEAAVEMVLDWHDQMLIKNWNDTVTDDDNVWFLGDLGLCSREHLASLVSQLKGHKHMLFGNHDHYSATYYATIGFETVSKKPVSLLEHFFLSHGPRPDMLQYPNIYYVFGHIHSKIHHEGDEAFDTQGPNYYCVCVERTNFRPIQLDAFNTFRGVAQQ